MAGSCEVAKERPGFIKDVEFLNWSGDYYLLKKGCAAWSLVI
jgi:hypothetical protein